MIKFMYDNNNPNIHLVMTETEDVNLSVLFAKFIEFTRMMGYQEGSWHNILKDLCVDELDEDYSIFDFAIDMIVPIS